MNTNCYYEKASDLLNQVGSSFIYVYFPEIDTIKYIEEQELFSSAEDMLILPYERELISFKKTVQLYEAETGLDFETYHPNVADRIREAGHEHQFREFQLSLLDKLMTNWLHQQSIS